MDNVMDNIVKAEAGYFKEELMLATLGTEPQVVTLTLDLLLARGYKIKETRVIYTEEEGVREAMAILQEEFKRGVYPGIDLKAVPVKNQEKSIRDFHSPEELKVLMQILYREVQQGCFRELPLHLCLAGGRKVMSIFAMVTAQLLFGPEDRVWYLLTEGWRPGAERRLHAAPKDNVKLIPIPVLRWREASTLLRMVSDLGDPLELVEWLERLNRQGQERRKEQFIRRYLTPAEREVVRLVCLGLDNATIASRLHKKEQTVANQLRSVYEKLREWLEYPEGRVERNVLIAEFAPYFKQREKLK